MGVLTGLLQLFLVQFTDGSVRLTPDALWLLGTFYAMELALTGIWFTLRREFEWAQLIQKTLLAAVLLWLITNWSPLTRALVKGFIGAGLKAGGDVISETDFTDPDNIATYGVSATAAMFVQIAQYAGLDAFKNLVEILGTGSAGLLIILLYFGMGVWVFITLLEFYLTSAISVILLPWGMLGKTAWLTEKAFAHLFASGVRLLVLSFILGSALPFMQTTSTQAGTSFAAALRVLLGALALLLLSWRANGLAQGLIHGAPSLVLHDTTQLVHTFTAQMTRLSTVLEQVADRLHSQPPPSPPHATPHAQRPLP
jgi:type IV secretion system protein TrbL